MEYTCPHCGAPIGAFDTKCEFCGSAVPNNFDIAINGNNNRVDIDWYNEDNWFNRLCADTLWVLTAGVFIYIFYLIAFSLWL